jgi:uncharacterized protein
MILNLRQFDQYPAETTIQANPDELGRFADSVVRIEVAGVDLAIQKSAQEYYCQGRVTARVVLECARCLGEFEADLGGETDFVVCSENYAAQHRGVDSEDCVCFKGNDLQVDIVEPVRQALVLAMSMKPLCSENCRGLCPTCGVNLNEQTCECKQETTDSRWDGLRNLSPDRKR